jgi:hypothetical protein
MPKFNFDGEQRLIYGREDAVVGGVFRFTVEELYSEWKAWVHSGAGAMFLPAFRVLGGDPIGAGISVGTYVFLRTDLGWGVVPPLIQNVTMEIIGNFYPEVSTDPVMVTNVGYTTTLIMRNSNLAQGVATSGATVDNAAIASAVRSNLQQAPPIPVNLTQVRGQTINGTGTAIDPWRP